MKALFLPRGCKPTSLGFVPCQVTAKASAPQGPWCGLSVWLQQGVPEDRAWSKPIDFYALSCSSFRKKARNLIETAQRKSQGVSFKSLTENIDTSTATGNLVFQIFGALAEFERNLITERTVAGLEAARSRGRKGGRPRRNPSSGRVNYAKRLYTDQKLTISEILELLNVSKSTLYRWLDLPAQRQELDKANRKKQ